MSIPEKLKKELLLAFKFRRVGTTWKRAHDQPEILRLTNHDCSQEYRNPRLIWSQSRLVVEARIYDDVGFDLMNGATLLGDWLKARSRCEELLAGELHQAIAESAPGAGHAKWQAGVVVDRAASSSAASSSADRHGFGGAAPQGV
jgi:hypothetical protein